MIANGLRFGRQESVPSFTERNKAALLMISAGKKGDDDHGLNHGQNTRWQE